MSEQNQLVVRPRQEIRAFNQNRGREIPHISKEAVWELAEKIKEISKGKKQKVRNSLLVRTIFDTACRCSEVVGNPESNHTGFRFVDLIEGQYGNSVRIEHTKGNKNNREIAISKSIYNEIQTYCLTHYPIAISEPTTPIFDIGRKRVWQILNKAFIKLPHIHKPHGVGAVHFLRHSGAIHRLAMTKNPKAVQDQLGHTSLDMTMNYVKTLSSKESLVINQQIDND
ncbi:uncharacterized protein METZ01_LOCUS99977 [marine metagenome]|uniref:Tyr recombinase domain-containing protein n=1 Tax=marine metagenome TaxID=408172 RepID=A0A381W5E4_9ZZZZ|tara:strand:+ start:5656 stop:6333 length:678 start_codon:yes stop_codon:yes gene_type:complete